MYIKGNVFIDPSYPLYFGIGDKRFDRKVKYLFEQWIEQLNAYIPVVSISVQNEPIEKDKYGNVNLEVPTLNEYNIKINSINESISSINKLISDIQESKQDKFTVSGDNIHFENNVLSIDSTTDLDIKDLVDSTNLRNTWSNKQDKLVAGDKIKIEDNVISAIGTDINDSIISSETTWSSQKISDKITQTADAKISAVTGSNAISVTGEGTSKVVSLLIDSTNTGNVTLSQTSTGLTANVDLSEVQNDITGLATNEKVLSLTSKKLATTLKLDYNSTSNKIQIKGVGDTVVTELDASAFTKDGMLDDVSIINTVESGVSVATPYLKFTFNTASGKNVQRISLSELVDVYNGANLNLTSNYAAALSYSAPTSGDSMDTAIGKLAKGVEDASTAGVTTFMGKDGAITANSGSNTNGAVNFFIDTNKKVTASVYGLGTAAYTASTAYATATQGDYADSALQSLNHGTDTNYINLALTNKSGNNGAKVQTISASATVQPINTADATHRGLLEAKDAKDYIDNALSDFDNHVSLTQAEYDALSNEEKNNGTIYLIRDANLPLEGLDTAVLITSTNKSTLDDDYSLDTPYLKFSFNQGNSIVRIPLAGLNGELYSLSSDSATIDLIEDRIEQWGQIIMGHYWDTAISENNAVIVGSGTYDNRENIHELTWNGTSWTKQDVTSGGTAANPAHRLSNKVNGICISESDFEALQSYQNGFLYFVYED